MRYRTALRPATPGRESSTDVTPPQAVRENDHTGGEKGYRPGVLSRQNCSVFAWLWRDARRSRRLLSRVIEGAREVGVLFITFGPLEAAFSGPLAQHTVRDLLLFVGIGAFLFFGSLALEWRFDDHG